MIRITDRLSLYDGEVSMATEITRPLLDFGSIIRRNVLAIAPHGSGGIDPRTHADHYRMGAAELDEPYLLTFYNYPATPLMGIANHRSFSTTSKAYLDAHWYTGSNGVTISDWEDYAQAVYQLHAPANPGAFLGILQSNHVAEIIGHAPHDEPMPAAIVFENAAFFPYDLVHEARGYELLAHILALTADVVGNSGSASASARASTLAEEYAARVKAREEEARVARAEGFITQLRTFIENRSGAKLRETIARTETMARDIELLRVRMVQQAKEMHEQMNHALTLSRIKPTVDLASIEAMRKLILNGTLTNLRGHPDGRLEFTTRPLLALDDRTLTYHRIGIMKVSLNIEDGGVTFLNQDQRVDAYSSGMNAPHVFDSGRPCMGNFSEMMADLVMKQDWYTAVELCISFIETANTDDPAGRHVHKWPVVADPTRYGYPAYPVGFVPVDDFDPDARDESDQDYEPDDRPELESISIMRIMPNGRPSYGEFEMRVGEGMRLDVNFEGYGDFDRDVSWYSADEDIATVNHRGVITAHAPGVVTIEAISQHDNDIMDSIELEVLAEAEPVPA
jgi:hypothetical protein